MEKILGILLTTIKEKNILISDGAWGTFLYELGLKVGDCPELWNISHYEDVFQIAKRYVDAGSDIILTNSFGANPKRLKHYGLSDKCRELNIKAAQISKKAANKNCIVLGSIGPSGERLRTGNISKNELFDGFKIQAHALKEGGADAFCIETMTALDEAVLAVKAAASTGLEVACTFTFNKDTDDKYKTMMGDSPFDIIYKIKEAGASIIGTNCGNGFDQMNVIVEEFRKLDSEIPILVHANAGLPKIKNGKEVYSETPETMAARVFDLINSGANIIGGCCGTTPEHIKAMKMAVKKCTVE